MTDKDPEEIFEELKGALMQDQYYIPREYYTAGDRWTVDTWEREGLTLKLMDEGWTTIIRGDGLWMSSHGGEVVMLEGSALIEDIMIKLGIEP